MGMSRATAGGLGPSAWCNMVIVPNYEATAADSENRPTGRITRNWERDMLWERARQDRLATQTQAAIQAKFDELVASVSGGSHMDWVVNKAIPELDRRTKMIAGFLQAMTGVVGDCNVLTDALTGAPLVPSDTP